MRHRLQFWRAPPLRPLTGRTLQRWLTHDVLREPAESRLVRWCGSRSCFRWSAARVLVMHPLRKTTDDRPVLLAHVLIDVDRDPLPVQTVSAVPRGAGDPVVLTGGGVVVDLGCGTGQLAVPLSPHCAAVVGVDPEPGVLEQALGPVTGTCGSDADTAQRRVAALEGLGLVVQVATWQAGHLVDAGWVVGHLGSALSSGILAEQDPQGLGASLRQALADHAHGLDEEVTTTAVIGRGPA